MTTASEQARSERAAPAVAIPNLRADGLRARSVWTKFRRSRLAVIGGVILAVMAVSAVLAPWLAPYDPYEQAPLERLAPPSLKYLLGTDQLGRDNLSRILYGGRSSLTVGIIAVGIGLTVGTLIGLASAFYGGLVDSVFMRCMDVLLAFPGILLALAIVAALGPGLINCMLAVGIWSIPVFARMVRGSALTVRGQDYVIAATALGASDVRISLRHILPNVAAPILVLASLRMATALLTAAGLSFLGLGAQAPTAEWGAMLNDGRQYVTDAPHVATFPGLAIMLTVLSLNFLGDGLRDALDPRLNM